MPTPVTASYTSSGFYTLSVPSNVTSVTVEAWGAGGGGGGNNNSQDGGGGGGGGAYARAQVDVVAGSTYYVNVGTGGNAIASSEGIPGRPSYFSSASNVLNIGTFLQAGGVSEAIQQQAVVPLSDGRMIIGGQNFVSYSGSTQTCIVCINPDGTIYTPVSGTDNSQVNTIVQQRDGKIVFGGTFTRYSGSASNTAFSASTLNQIARINYPQGNIDSTFNPGQAFAGGATVVRNMIVQSDDKLVVTGQNLTIYSGSSIGGVVRINTSGTLDTTFNAGAGIGGGTGFWLTQQSDNKIILVGSFTTYSGSTVNNIVRLNTDGTRDTTFNTGTGFNNTLRTVEQQADGKILVGGAFTTYSGSAVSFFVRLNSDGTIDSTFRSGSGFNAQVISIAIQPDNKIIAGGDFRSYSGSAVGSIVRLDISGSIDTTFNPGGIGYEPAVLRANFVTVTGSFVYVIATQTSGMLYNRIPFNTLSILNTNGQAAYNAYPPAITGSVYTGYLAFAEGGFAGVSASTISNLPGAGGNSGSLVVTGSTVNAAGFAGGRGGAGRDSATGRGGPGGSSAGTGSNGTSGATVWTTEIAAAAPGGGGIGGNGGTTTAGVTGSAPGGGGGGAGDNGAGGNLAGGAGATGRVLVYYTIPDAATTKTYFIRIT